MRIPVIIGLIMTLNSCDQIWYINDKIKIGGSGYIYSTTGNNLNSVTVIVYHDADLVDSTYSDSIGFFDGTNWERCLICPSVSYDFKKTGYKSKTLEVAEYVRSKGYGRVNLDSIVVILEKE